MTDIDPKTGLPETPDGYVWVIQTMRADDYDFFQVTGCHG